MTSKGRIALLHYTALPVVGGVEVVVGRHATLLADAGYDVAIVAGRGRSPDPRVEFVRIPIADDVDSLNVVVAAGIALAAVTV